MAEIKKCTCKHTFQDKMYGFGNRVMNPIKKSGANQSRCTVCSKIS